MLTEGCHCPYSGVCRSRNAQPLCMRINCEDRVYVHGYYWVFYYFISDCHGYMRCCTTVTYCTHCDYCRHCDHCRHCDYPRQCYQDNVMPIEKHRRAPVNDFEPSLLEELYHPEHEYEQQWASFHIYFALFKHMPSEASKKQRRVDFRGAASKSLEPPNNLSYPINVDRDMARDRSLTQNVEISVMELRPLPYLDNRFMPMLCCNAHQMQHNQPTELSLETHIPNTIAILQYLLYKGNSIICHSYTYSWCPRIHTFVPTAHYISVFHHTVNKYSIPIYIQTLNDPPYDDRMRHKISQISALSDLYLVCYEFHTLESQFLFQRSQKKKKITIFHIKCSLANYKKFPKFISTKYVEKFRKKSNCTCD